MYQEQKSGERVSAGKADVDDGDGGGQCDCNIIGQTGAVIAVAWDAMMGRCFQSFLNDVNRVDGR